MDISIDILTSTFLMLECIAHPCVTLHVEHNCKKPVSLRKKRVLL